MPTRMSPVKHGTPKAYRNAGCRCEGCRAANRRYQREYRAARKNGYTPAPGVKPPTVKQHRQSGLAGVDRKALADLLNEMFPLGLTSDCPARRKARA
jgi:hypothetical protein